MGTSPALGAMGSNPKKIVLEFDENIQLSNASQKVVVSPPQINQPEITALGKRITIELQDSLQPNTTYTIDFGDAIQDSNEGNPMGDYAFTFSTGAQVDTFQVSGYVLNAADLEPIQGINVGLYSADSTTAAVPDSAFRTRALERISRTDGAGHFVIKGLDPKKKYRVFALQDQDQNYLFSQKSEVIAFNSQLVQSSAKPDLRPDTVWHDSIYYDSIRYTPYTHFYPDDITLLAFTEDGQKRAYLKGERPQLEKFTIYFTAPDDQLPQIRGLNFNENGLFTVEKTERNDTLTYWLRDSLVYNQDTLRFTLTYRATDSLNHLTPRTDTLQFVSKITYEKTQKRKAQAWEEYAKEYRKDYRRALKEKQMQEEFASEEGENSDGDKKQKKKKKEKIEDEDIVVPPMPETFLEVRAPKTTLDPDENYEMRFSTPIDTAYASRFQFYQLIDSDTIARPFRIRRVAGSLRNYRLYAEWEPGAKYLFAADTGAVADLYGMRNEAFKRSISVKELETYATLNINLHGAEDCAVVQLLNASGNVAKEQRPKNGRVEFYFINPGTYYLRAYYDRDGNNRWTTGDYDMQLQPEPMYYYPGAFSLRADWVNNQDWPPAATPLYKQKPGKITKQKADQTKSIKSKNAEREKQKAKERGKSNKANRSK